MKNEHFIKVLKNRMAYNKNTNRGYHDKGNKFKEIQMLQWAISKAIKDFKYHSWEKQLREKIYNCFVYTSDTAEDLTGENHTIPLANKKQKKEKVKEEKK